jgi:hypothetical protein
VKAPLERGFFRVFQISFLDCTFRKLAQIIQNAKAAFRFSLLANSLRVLDQQCVVFLHGFYAFDSTVKHRLDLRVVLLTVENANSGENTSGVIVDDENRLFEGVQKDRIGGFWTDSGDRE